MKMRISPDFDKEQIEVIDSVKGMGKKRTTKVKHMVLGWLMDYDYLKRRNNH